MDETMGVTLSDYVESYGKKDPHQKVVRAIQIIEHGGTSEQQIVEASQLAYKILSDSRNLGMFKRLQMAVTNYFKAANKSVPMSISTAAGKFNESQIMAEYNSLIKKKDMEISAQMKSLIKDSMRISLDELG